ncbi:MAG TPA: alkaline phosphatase family protein [Candidatus Acidoferrum sp.]|nr:alkaline phosphatase family protein [Candidatus Acidoferrum sp.]
MRRVFATLLAGVLLNPGMIVAVPEHHDHGFGDTATPIKHLVIIFQENVSFDHYFGTYPNALNLPGENAFYAKSDTPTINGFSPALLTSNPNLNPANGTAATNPFRLSPAKAATNDQDHNYTPEQEAYDGGLMDLFPKFTGTAGPPPGTPPIADTKGLVMGYYDGNTVTALWNYAQHFAMSDNSYDTNFGPSTPGALNVISGQTNGVIDNTNGSGAITADGNGGFSDTGDADPAGDVCSTTTGETFSMSGQSIGDLLNAKGISWGFFSGGFNLGILNANGTTGCARSTTSTITLSKKADYIPHHQPFQYYPSTANPLHTRPASIAEIGHNGPANHQYDIQDFFAAVSAGNFPAVSYLKAPGFQDGHAGYSDPIDEQTFIVNTINFLEKTREWESTAVIIAYDDSDGWYDHVTSPLLNQSATAADQNSAGAYMCGSVASATATALPGISAAHAQGRCGYGPRQPFLVISPFARKNFVDHSITDQSSVVRFIEDNWLGGERITGSFDAIAGSITGMFDFDRCREDGVLILDPTTGERADHH